MSSWPSNNTPDVHKEFERANRGEVREERRSKAPAAPPTTPLPLLALRPNGATVQAVHTKLDDAARAQVSPALQSKAQRAARANDHAKAQRLLRPEFNRVRGVTHEP